MAKCSFCSMGYIKISFRTIGQKIWCSQAWKRKATADAINWHHPKIYNHPVHS